MFNRVRGPGSFPNGISRRELHADLPLELRELLEQQAVQSSMGPEPAHSDWPVSIYVPEHYEENFAYPLLVWFHDFGSHEGQVESVMAAISQQNYCGLGIQGNKPLSGESSFDWDPELLEYRTISLRDLLSVTIRRLRQTFHIHSERIFLAGAGNGADIALQQLAQMPQWYAGAVMFSPACCSSVVDALRVSNLQDKSLLWTVARTASDDELARNVEAVQLTRMAGGEPEVRVTDTVVDPESSDVRFVDHWLLSRMAGQAYA